MPTLRAVEFFSGIGGWHYGAEEACATLNSSGVGGGNCGGGNGGVGGTEPLAVEVVAALVPVCWERVMR